MKADAILSSRPRGGKVLAPDAGEIWRLLDDIAARGRAIRLARQSAEAGGDGGPPPSGETPGDRLGDAMTAG